MNINKVYQLYMNREIPKNNIIDIREKSELKNGKINGSQHIPMGKLLANPNQFLQKEEKYYLLCQSGARSLVTTIKLKLKGFKVNNISGGYIGWQRIVK